MQPVYLDNAATAPLHTEVLEAMLPHMQCGNPSSIHSHGRKAKVAVEKVRKQVAALLNVAPAEVFFTSGGTEGNNLALQGCVAGAGITQAITSPLEHQAVLGPLAQMAQQKGLQVHHVQVDAQGCLDHDHLAHLLQRPGQTLVSLMHANNELGNLYNLARIGELCKEHGAVFHTDAVQTLGRLVLDWAALPVHMMVGSAHKLHGPKGVGVLYVRGGTQVTPLMQGGAQERNVRPGTENVAVSTKTASS